MCCVQLLTTEVFRGGVLICEKSEKALKVKFHDFQSMHCANNYRYKQCKI